MSQPRPNQTPDDELLDELEQWEPEYLPELWLWLRQWACSPRRVFWIFDTRTLSWGMLT